MNITVSDNAFKYQYKIPLHTYHKYCKNYYSQNGEDGIIEELLKELNIKSGIFCDLGASDGIISSNTYHLIKNHNFRGIAIESDESNFLKLKKNYQLYPNVEVHQSKVQYDDINNDLNFWLQRSKTRTDLDVLSIDIDGDDYFVWQNLTISNPKIVLFEINAYRDPVFNELPNQPSSEYLIDPLKLWYPYRIACGCSFISGIALGLQKSYIPIAFTGNIIFVRKDLVYLLKSLPYKISENPYDYLTLYTHLVLWDNIWKTTTGLILNTAIRDYYLGCKKKVIHLPWINKRMTEILNNQKVIF